MGTWLRRLGVGGVGLLLTAAMLMHVRAHEGVYWTQVNVVFLAPQSSRLPNQIQDTNDSVIATAGLMESLLRTKGSLPLASSSSASLTGTGVSDGYWIRLLQSGSQWEANYDKPVLEVQVAGPTPGEVESRTGVLVSRIERQLDRFQDDDGVPSVDRITTLVSPGTPNIRYSTGQPSRAALATLLLGGLLTVMAVTASGTVRRRLGDLRAMARVPA